MCHFHQFCILTNEIIEIEAPFVYNVNIRVSTPKMQGIRNMTIP